MNFYLWAIKFKEYIFGNGQKGHVIDKGGGGEKYEIVHVPSFLTVCVCVYVILWHRYYLYTSDLLKLLVKEGGAAGM